MSTDPHANQPVVTAGASIDGAKLVTILFHGRGASPASMITLAERLDLDGVAVLAPAAAGGRWYPQGFMEPTERNEPDLGSALNVASTLVERCIRAGIGRERLVLGGFSQGACLAAEWVARNPARYGAVVVLSGGLIGPAAELPVRKGTFDGTPVFIGCSDDDPWIPLERVRQTESVLRGMGADVETAIFANAEHTIRDDEVKAFDSILQQLRH